MTRPEPSSPTRARARFAATRRERGICFTPPRGANGESAAQYLDFTTGAIDLGFTVSPDGRYVLWS